MFKEIITLVKLKVNFLKYPLTTLIYILYNYSVNGKLGACFYLSLDIE